MSISNTPLTELKEVSASFGTQQVLSGLSLVLWSGRNLLLMGPSGAGKSTLLRILAGLLAPQHGSVLLNGEPASIPGKILIPPQKRHLTMVFQDLGLWPNLSVLDNVLLGLSGTPEPQSQKRERALKWLEACNLTSQARSRPSQLSGGEQQRAAIARALALEPKLILLDEPFSGLDLALRHSLLLQIASLSRQQGITLLLASHHLPDGQRLDADVAVLEDGRIVEQGAPDTLLAHPTSRTLQAWASEGSRNGR